MSSWPSINILSRFLAVARDPALRELSLDELSELLNDLRHPAPPPPESNGTRPQRWQDHLIEDRIAPGSTVLDLGCGTGELLLRLRDRKQIKGQGIELDAAAVFQCVARGVPVFQSNLDMGLKGFADQSFDYVILEETLQTLHHPIAVLQEMLRVGRRGIVSFPNFAYWRVRMYLALHGRMPVTEELPRPWYDTPNIHLFTLQDFLDWAETAPVRMVETHVLCDGRVRPLQANDSLYAEEVLTVVERRSRLRCGPPGIS